MLLFGVSEYRTVVVVVVVVVVVWSIEISEFFLRIGIPGC